MRYRLQRHDGTDCSATMVPITVLRMVPIQRYRHINTKEVFDPIKETLFFTCIYKLFWIIVLCLLLFSLLFSVRHVPGKVPGVLFPYIPEGL